MVQVSRHIRRGDLVLVISGKDKGETGEVLQVLREAGRVLVRGINLKTHHKKPRKDDPGGIKRLEAPIHASNVMHVDPRTGRPTRVGMTFKNDVKVRYAKKSGDLLDKKTQKQKEETDKKEVG